MSAREKVRRQQIQFFEQEKKDATLTVKPVAAARIANQAEEPAAEALSHCACFREEETGGAMGC